MKRIGLILGGGGANGRFQVEVFRILRDKYGLDLAALAYIAGISTGALQAAGLRKGGLPLLERVWNGVTESDVFRRRGWISAAWHFMRGGLGLYDHRPLRKLLKRELGEAVLDADVGFVRIDDGALKYEVAAVDTVMASCTIPLAFEPVEGPADPETGIRPLLVDGGLATVCPIGQAMGRELDQVIVISCNNLDGVPFKRPRNIVELALRCWEILYWIHQRNDVDGYNRINRILAQIQPGHPPIVSESGRPYTHGDVVFIQPSKSGLPSTLDFSAGAMAARVAAAAPAVHTAMEGRAA